MSTDPSYVLLFTHELINYSISSNAAFNASMLARLRDNYGERDELPGKYLSEGLGDFLYELGELKLAEESFPQDPCCVFLDRSTSTKNKLMSMPTSFWQPYIGDYSESDFFRRHRSKIMSLFKESLAVLQTLYENEGKDLSRLWVDRVTVPKRRLYRLGAVDRQLMVNELVDMPAYRPSENLYRDISAIMRISENVVRLKCDEQTQVDVEDAILLRDLIREYSRKDVGGRLDWGTCVNGGLTSATKAGENDKSQAEARPIALDFTVVQQLHSESDELLETFREYFGEEEGFAALDSNTPDSPVPVDASQCFELLSADFAAEDNEFIDRLNEYELRFLLGFTGGKRDLEDANEYFRGIGLMAGKLVNDLNEKAMQYLGDNIIEYGNSCYEICADFGYILGKIEGK